MNWRKVFGMAVAVGALTATAVRAGEDAIRNDVPAEQKDAPSDSAPAAAAHPDDPQTVAADGVPVRKPNPISDFLKRAEQLGDADVEMPLVDDFRTDGTGTDGDHK